MTKFCRTGHHWTQINFWLKRFCLLVFSLIIAKGFRCPLFLWDFFSSQERTFPLFHSFIGFFPSVTMLGFFLYILVNNFSLFCLLQWSNSVEFLCCPIFYVKTIKRKENKNHKPTTTTLKPWRILTASRINHFLWKHFSIVANTFTDPYSHECSSSFSRVSILCRAHLDVWYYVLDISPAIHFILFSLKKK